MNAIVPLVPNAAELARWRVPALSAMPPVKELLPDSVVVPGPS